MAVTHGEYASETLSRERYEIAVALGGTTNRFLDPPDGGDVSLAEQVRRVREALEKAEAERDALKAALKGCVSSLEIALMMSVPVGWKVVPIEPTREMLPSDSSRAWYGIWKSMLSKAPPPPAPDTSLEAALQRNALTEADAVADAIAALTLRVAKLEIAIGDVA